jgi:formamidopyrimidine-DNA glycosylase
VPDDIVQGDTPPEAFVAALKGRTVTEIGRKGKYWWIELDQKPWLFGHLGMAGWIRELDAPTVRLREHGKAPLDDANGRPRFLKLMLTAEDGKRISFTDQRRLGRMWLGISPEEDPRISALGFDCYAEIPPAKELHAMLVKRKAPIKAILLDQSLFAGVGNWIADETLYHARISPKRTGDTLKPKETERLREALYRVVHTAVEAGADSDKYPEDWLFSSRWGGKKGRTEIGGKKIVRETVGGRTSAWVPAIQK